MQTFKEHMVEYLRCVEQENFNDPSFHLLVEELNPGFKDRLAVYSKNVDTYEETGNESLLVNLLKEEFILSGMEEDATVEKMRRTFERAKERRRDWKFEDLKLSKS